MSLTNCRFYEEKYPEVDSYVMVNVKQVCDRRHDVSVLLQESLANDYLSFCRSPKWAHT